MKRFCNLQSAIPLGSILLACLLAPAAAQAQAGRSLDEELLNNLRAQSKSDVEREVLGKGEKKASQPAALGDERDRLNRRLQQELGAAAEKESDNPLVNIAQNMAQVKERIAQADVGATTLNMQKQVVADLDLLINQACKSCGQCSGSSSAKQSACNSPSSSAKPGAKAGQKPGNRPAAKGAPRSGGGDAEQADKAEMRAMMNNLWGELPANARQQMQQTPVDDFIPKYRDLIEDYFRDLSNEKKSAE